MKIDFLGYLDDKQRTYCVKNGIKNLAYIDYTSLFSNDIKTEHTFFIAKGTKTRVLICYDNIWIDLTDYDIIDMISKLDESDVYTFLNEMKNVYKGNWSNFVFKIDENEFQGKGINYSLFDLAKKIETEADFDITLGDLLFVINMVLNKDIEGEQYRVKGTRAEKEKILLIERTLIKYILLIKYYRFDDKDAKEYLQKIEYPLYEGSSFLKNKMKVKKYDKKFNKSLFEQSGFLC